MSENTQGAACTEAEWEAARDAGLPVFTTKDERAIHAFAEAIRQQNTADTADPFGYFRATPFGWEDCADTDEGATALYEHTAPDQSAEIERLRECLHKANNQAEHFERNWYLRGDEIDALREQVRVLSEALAPFAAILPGSLDSVGGGTLVTPTIKVQMAKEARAALAAVRDHSGSPAGERGKA